MPYSWLKAKNFQNVSLSVNFFFACFNVSDELCFRKTERINSEKDTDTQFSNRFSNSLERFSLVLVEDDSCDAAKASTSMYTHRMKRIRCALDSFPIFHSHQHIVKIFSHDFPFHPHTHKWEESLVQATVSASLQIFFFATNTHNHSWLNSSEKQVSVAAVHWYSNTWKSGEREERSKRRRDVITTPKTEHLNLIKNFEFAFPPK